MLIKRCLPARHLFTFKNLGFEIPFPLILHIFYKKQQSFYIFLTTFQKKWCKIFKAVIK